jgi:cytochrome P450
MANFYLYFPFLTCGVKYGTEALGVADQQNAHSMTLVVRAVADLFQTLRRSTEVNRKIVAFSVARSSLSSLRHTIHECSLMALDGDRWTAYRFLLGFYKTWMPNHLGRLCEAIDSLTLERQFAMDYGSVLS